MAMAGEEALALVVAADEGTFFLEGPAGVGKTALARRRLRHLLRRRRPDARILLLVPYRGLLPPYEVALRDLDLPPDALLRTTLAGLARRTIRRFWPQVAEAAGFAHPDRPPRFLTLEMAQYVLQRVVGPLLEGDYFQGLPLPRPHLLRQLLDNLNRAALVGFPITEIAPRLQAALGPESPQSRFFVQAQDCALRFRRYCLDHNLLDFSLQIELFARHLLPRPQVQADLFDPPPHLIVDNVEETVPVTQDLLRALLPSRVASALLLYDREGGYRRFLGADPEGGYALKERCQHHLVLEESRVTPAPLVALEQALTRALGGRPTPYRGWTPLDAEAPAVTLLTGRFYPQMLDRVADEVVRLITEEEFLAGEIAILAPYLPDALRFALGSRLAQAGVPVRVHRPSRPFQAEPVTRHLLTLAALGHPWWQEPPATEMVAHALSWAVVGLDLLRARLLARILYRLREGEPRLLPFDGLEPEARRRIGLRRGERYERLRRWLADYGQEAAQDPTAFPLDHFWDRLVEEILSRPGFGLHAQPEAHPIVRALITSARRFRRLTEPDLLPPDRAAGHEYLLQVQAGLLAPRPRRSDQGQRGVLLAPVHTFLLYHRPVAVQFWLDVGSSGWWQPPHQVLTNPYVLSRRWPADRRWTGTDEQALGLTALTQVVQGLLRRCRQRVYLVSSLLGEEGFEQRGPLLRAVQTLLRRREVSIR